MKLPPLSTVKAIFGLASHSASASKAEVKGLRVLMVPSWTSPNPYQSLLAGEIARCGFDVRFGPNKILTLAAALILSRPNVIHLHWTDPYWICSSRLLASMRVWAFAWLLGACHRHGVKIIWTLHEIDNHDQKHPQVNRLCNKLIGEIADRVIVHAPCAEEAVARFIPPARGKTVVIPHPNYIPAYENTVSAQTARRELGLQEGSFVFLFLGTIRPYKGIIELIHSFKNLSLEGAKLVIAGGGPSAFVREVEKEVGEDPAILFHAGFVGNERVQYYLNASNAVVLPYRRIFDSGSMLLAMSFGKALIIPRMGSICDVVSKEEALLYDPSSPSGLEKALRQASQSRTGLEEMGQRAREKVREWDWSKAAIQTVQIYRDGQ